MPKQPRFVIQQHESSDAQLVIRDLAAESPGHPAVCDEPDQVVERLARAGLLHERQRLVVITTPHDGASHEIRHHGGRFTGFELLLLPGEPAYDH